MLLSYPDPATARQYADEGLALARQTGMPTAIVFNLLSLGQAVAASEPDRARALLAEALQLAATLRYENPTELGAAVFLAGRLEEWPATLRVAGRALHHHIRSGTTSLATLVGILNVVARGLAEPRPESAATLQGAADAMIRRHTGNAPGAVSGGARDSTTQLLNTTLDESRLRELHAEGAAMDENQACTYACTHIDEYLATTTEAPH